MNYDCSSAFLFDLTDADLAKEQVRLSSAFLSFFDLVRTDDLVSDNGFVDSDD